MALTFLGCLLVTVVFEYVYEIAARTRTFASSKTEVARIFWLVFGIGFLLTGTLNVLPNIAVLLPIAVTHAVKGSVF